MIHFVVKRRPKRENFFPKPLQRCHLLSGQIIISTITQLRTLSWFTKPRYWVTSSRAFGLNKLGFLIRTQVSRPGPTVSDRAQMLK